MDTAALVALLGGTFVVRSLAKDRLVPKPPAGIVASQDRNLEVLREDCADYAENMSYRLQQSWYETWLIHSIEPDALGDLTHHVHYVSELS